MTFLFATPLCKPLYFFAFKMIKTICNLSVELSVFLPLIVSNKVPREVECKCEEVHHT